MICKTCLYMFQYRQSVCYWCNDRAPNEEKALHYLSLRELFGASEQTAERVARIRAVDAREFVKMV